MIQFVVIVAVSVLIGCAVVVLALMREGRIAMRRGAAYRGQDPAARSSGARARVAFVFAIAAIGVLLLVTPMLMASQGPSPSRTRPGRRSR